jgi:hypothetical protein
MRPWLRKIGRPHRPCDPQPTLTEDQAVLGWLAAQSDTPSLTSDLMLDTLGAWHSLGPLPELAAEPRAGPDCDRVHVQVQVQVLEQITDRLVQHLHDGLDDEQARGVRVAARAAARPGLAVPRRPEARRAGTCPALRDAAVAARPASRNATAVDAAQAAAIEEAQRAVDR